MMKIKRIFNELMTPSALESDTQSNIAYRKSVVAIAHCVLSAAIISALVYISVPYLIASVCLLTFYSVKELLDLFEGGGYADFFEDMSTTAMGAFFALSGILPIVAIAVGFVVFLIHV